MSDRYDCVVPRKYKGKDGSEKTSWTKIGVCFPNAKGGYRVTLEALPLQQMNRDGTGLECTFLLMEPRDPKNNFDPEQKRGGGRQRNDGPEDIPF